MTTLSLTHNHADGTLLDGTAKGDGSADVLRARPGFSHWKWSRNIGEVGAWYLPHSRDKPAQRYQIDATAEALTAAGFNVWLDVDDKYRPTAEVVADKRQRSADRAEALHAKAERQEAAAEVHYDRVKWITDHRPLGQPILLGHHSQRKAERDQAKVEQGMDRWVAGRAEAAETERRAQAAEGNATRRESRRTVENRVKKLRADIARDLRTLHGYWRRWGEVQTWGWEERLGRHVPRAFPVDPDSDHGQELCARITGNTEARHHWAGVLAERPAPPKPAKPTKGDTVEVDGAWLPVVRSSKHDITVSWPSENDPKRTRRVPWGHISDWNRTESTDEAGA